MQYLRDDSHSIPQCAVQLTRILCTSSLKPSSWPCTWNMTTETYTNYNKTEKVKVRRLDTNCKLLITVTQHTPQPQVTPSSDSLNSSPWMNDITNTLTVTYAVDLLTLHFVTNYQQLDVCRYWVHRYWDLSEWNTDSELSHSPVRSWRSHSFSLTQWQTIRAHIKKILGRLLVLNILWQ